MLIELKGRLDNCIQKIKVYLLAFKHYVNQSFYQLLSLLDLQEKRQQCKLDLVKNI